MKLNDNQKLAINHYNGNCCVMASAGSGKTTVLVERVKRLINRHNVNAENILCITFSRKAKENMISRLGVEYSETNIETFHSLGFKIIREYNPNYSIIKDYEQKQIISNIVKNNRIENLDQEINFNTIISFISYCKNNIIREYNLEDFNNWSYEIQDLNNIYREYDIKKNDINKLDFDDMLIKCYDLLNKPNINIKYQNKFKFILVDEFQDTNKCQYELIKLLGVKNNNVFVVGDALQNIYEWRAANNNYIINFYNEWKDTNVINLDTNYRSIYNIVTLSNKLVDGTKETTHKNYIKSKSNKTKGMEPQFKIFHNECDESQFIINKILDRKYNYNDIAVLCRTNNQTQSIESMCYTHKIPYEIIGGKGFYQQKEILHMILFLRLIIDTSDDESFKLIYNIPNRYLGDIFLKEITSYSQKNKMSLYDSMLNFPRAEEWRYSKGIYEINKLISKLSARKRYNVGEIINIIRRDLNYDKYISNTIDISIDIKSEKIDNLDTLVHIASGYNDIKEFLLEVENFTEDDNSATENKIKIMTIHQSKGLEYKQVFVIGLNEGILPHKKSNNINEERRLLYVAMTRAEEELYISALEEYNNKKVDVSQFIYDIFDNVYKEKKPKIKKNKENEITYN